MDYLLCFGAGIFLGVALGWDTIKPQRPKSPRQTAREIEEAAREIERIQREAIERMRDLP